MDKQETSGLKGLYQHNLLEKCIFLNKKEVENWIENLFTWLFCTQEVCIDFDLFQQKEENLKKELNSFLEQVSAKNAVTISRALKNLDYFD